MEKPQTFEAGGQRIKVYPTHAWLDYDYGPTMRWSDEKKTDVPTMDYRAGCQMCFCMGPDAPMGNGEMSGRDIGHMIFRQRPPRPNPEIMAFYNSVRGNGSLV